MKVTAYFFGNQSDTPVLLATGQPYWLEALYWAYAINKSAFPPALPVSKNIYTLYSHDSFGETSAYTGCSAAPQMICVYNL